jgi:hypothetical protein
MNKDQPVIHVRSFALITQVHTLDAKVERWLHSHDWQRVNRTWTPLDNPNVVIRSQRRDIWRIAMRFRSTPPVERFGELAKEVLGQHPTLLHVRPVALRLPLELDEGSKLMLPDEPCHCMRVYPSGQDVIEVRGVKVERSLSLSRRVHPRLFADFAVGGTLLTSHGEPRRSLFLSDHPRPGTAGSDERLAAELVLALWKYAKRLRRIGVRPGLHRATRFVQIARLHVLASGKEVFDVHLPGIHGPRRLVVTMPGDQVPVGEGGLRRALVEAERRMRR